MERKFWQFRHVSERISSVCSPKLMIKLVQHTFSACLMMMCGGMFMSYGLFNNFIGYQRWSPGVSSPELFIAAASFHFAVAIGATVASSFYYKFETRKIHVRSKEERASSAPIEFLTSFFPTYNFSIFSSPTKKKLKQLFNTLLTLVASITLSMLPNNFITIVVSRTLFGLGFGSIYIISIMYASEISATKFRAKAIFTLHLSLTLGMFLFALLVLSLAPDFDLILRLSAIVSLVCSVASAAVGYFTMKTSHIFMMMKSCRESEARDRFQYFNRDSAAVDNNVELESLQTYIIEERKRSFNFLGSHNVTGLITVMLVKLGHLSIFNALHNAYRTLFLSVFLTIDDINYSELTMLGARLIGCITGLLLAVDQLSKKQQFFISTLASSLLLFTFGTLLTTSTDQLNLIWLPVTLFIPIECLHGFGVSQLDDVLSGEVFPFKEKAVSIATTIVFEQCVHIVFIIVYYSWIFSLGSAPNTLTFAFGGVSLACGLLLLHPAFLRDSRRLSLVEVAHLYSNKWR